MEEIFEGGAPDQEYTRPEVVDYGSLQALTLANGTAFVDTPMGTPAPSVTNGSTP